MLTRRFSCILPAYQIQRAGILHFRQDAPAPYERHRPYNYIPVLSRPADCDGVYYDVLGFDLAIENAKALLDEAGYPDVFTMTLDATNNRYVNDAQIAQALASMLAKINVNLELNFMPKSKFWDYIRVSVVIQLDLSDIEAVDAVNDRLLAEGGVDIVVDNGSGRKKIEEPFGCAKHCGSMAQTTSRGAKLFDLDSS